MTRKHFEAIAAIIADLTATTTDPSQAVDIAVRDHADAMADLCAKENSRFDRQRFLTACGF